MDFYFFASNYNHGQEKPTKNIQAQPANQIASMLLQSWSIQT